MPRYEPEREAAMSQPTRNQGAKDHRTQAHRDVLRLAVAAHKASALQTTVPTALLLALLDEHDTLARQCATLRSEMQSSFLEAA